MRDKSWQVALLNAFKCFQRSWKRTNRDREHKYIYIYIYMIQRRSSPSPPLGMVMVCPPVVRVDWCECWLMESLSLQVVLICTVLARNLTKCGNKGKYGRQAALNSLMVGRCAGAQGLGGPYHGGGEVNTEHGSIYTMFTWRCRCCNRYAC